MDRKRRFGLAVAAMRKQRGLSQEKLAELIDRSQESVSNLERGQTMPLFETIDRLSVALQIPLRDLVDALDESGPTDPRRVKLEARVVVAVRQLSLRDLQIAATQLQAFLDSPAR